MRIHSSKYEVVRGVGSVSELTTDQIKTHLAEMKHVYDTTRKMHRLEMYMYFLSLERSYVAYPHINNFCSTVHRLHPVKYSHDIAQDGKQSSFRWPIALILTCPTCSTTLSDKVAYTIHILAEPAKCNWCSTDLTYERLTILALEGRWRTNKSYIDFGGLSDHFPDSINTGAHNWETFCFVLKHTIGKSFNRHFRIVIKKFIRKFKDNLSSFRLDLVKGMYRQMDFVNKICCNFEYWNRPEVLKECVTRYNKFMNLIARTGKMLVPTMDIDLAWHSHQTYHADYMAFCMYINWGEPINHDDTIVTSVLKSAYARTYIRWSQRYKEPYSHHKPTVWEWQRGSWKTSIGVFPYGIYRYIVWKNHSDPKTLSLAELAIDKSGVAFIGTPVMDSTKRPKRQTAYDESLYDSLEAMEFHTHPNVTTTNDGGCTNGLGGGCSAYYGRAGGCGGGCGSGCGGGCGATEGGGGGNGGDGGELSCVEVIV